MLDNHNQPTFIGITDDRLVHMREVGRLCFELARDMLGWNEDECRQMFIMGFLHDIGYEFAQLQSEHAAIGGALLSDANYHHAEPIRLHGDPESDLTDDRLLILNIADMTISHNGRRIGIECRLQGIADRYGRASIQYQNAANLARSLYLECDRRGLDLPTY